VLCVTTGRRTSVRGEKRRQTIPPVNSNVGLLWIIVAALGMFIQDKALPPVMGY
jgi:hypothetical protein